MKILTLNAGSNSLKFEIIEARPNRSDSDNDIHFGSSLVSGAYDDIGKPNSTLSLRENQPGSKKEEVEIRDHGHATELLLDWIEHGGAREHGIRNLADIARIGHRIVHGADLFNGPTELSDEVIRQIEGLEDLAPLHNVSALKVVRTATARVKGRLPMIAVFDTVFHRTIPEKAALYALPPDLAQRNKIRRYGFHGISHRYMMIRYAQVTHRPIREVNLITLHLEADRLRQLFRMGSQLTLRWVLHRSRV